MCSNHFCNKKVCIDCICNQKVCVNHFWDKKVSKITIRCPSQNNMFLFLQFYSDYPETFQAIQKLSGPSGNILDHPENIQTILKLSSYPETFWTIWKISGVSWNFPGHRKLPGPSGKYPDYPETFQTIRRLPSAVSRVMLKNFLDAQKLFRMAMPRCHDGFCASAAEMAGHMALDICFVWQIPI